MSRLWRQIAQTALTQLTKFQLAEERPNFKDRTTFPLLGARAALVRAIYCDRVYAARKRALNAESLLIFFERFCAGSRITS